MSHREREVESVKPRRFVLRGHAPFTELRTAEPIRLRRPTKPLEYGALNFGQLRCIQCAEFANGASGRISGDALRDERALFEKRNFYFDFKLRVTQRGGMENNRDKGAVGIAERNAENQNRPDFLDHAAIEQPDFPAPRRHVPPHPVSRPVRRQRQRQRHR